jgi:hypothetical protein
MIRFPQGPAPGGAGGGRLPGFDDKLVSMYARGMTVREIQGHLADLYGIEMSPDLISAVTDAVLDEISEWQNRPLEPLYPLVFFDAIGQGPIPRSDVGKADRRVKIRDEGIVRNKVVYVALGGIEPMARWPQGDPRPLDRANRRRQVLAAGDDRAQEPRCRGRPDRHRRWPERLP